MILFICYSGVLGGAERQLVEFAAALPGERCIACPDGPLADAARGAGIRVFAIRARTLHVRLTARDRLLSIPRLAGHARELHALVGRLDPKLVVAWGMRSMVACVAAGVAGRSSLVFQHNDLLPGALIGRLVRAAAARADLVLTASQTVADDLDPAGRLAGRLEVVHPGIDVESFDPSPLPDGPPVVVVIGALVGWKRPDLALEAFVRVRAEHPDARLRLLGATLERGHALAERLLERSRRSDLAGAVELTGPVADPRAALREASCLLHCAEREPFGLVVLEALASGRPAIVPASGGPAEIVDRASGVLYPPGDVKGAAAAMLELLADPARAARLGAHGPERALQFDRARADRRFAAALAPLMRARPTGEATGVAIVTVTHNSAPELAALLRSVDRHLPGARVVVADNASDDDSVALARSWGGGATVVALEENLGFGRACNAALREVGEPVAVLLNPDVELLDDSLLELVREVLVPERGERLLAPLVLREDGSRQDSAHPVPASIADLTRAVLPPALVPGRAGARLAPWRSEHPRIVGWAVGCALVARTATLHDLGPFDPQIFMYGEDLDLGLRAAQAGIQTWFWPTARVLHRGAHSTDATYGGEPFELLATARRDVVARRLGPGRARLDDVAQRVTFSSRVALKRLARRPSSREQEQLSALARGRSRS